jgi:hypothetical protein
MSCSCCPEDSFDGDLFSEDQNLNSPESQSISVFCLSFEFLVRIFVWREISTCCQHHQSSVLERDCFRTMTVPAALHGFVVLAKSATGAACVDLIKQATSANGVYTFTPLLQAENVQRVSNTLQIVLIVACWYRIREKFKSVETLLMGNLSRL